MIATLIDKQDNFEIVRDQIAAVLAAEVANQMALATAAGKDPDDWKLRIFSERANPWEQFQDSNLSDKSPIVNVWYDNSGFVPGSSNISERQKAESVFNIDCYGYGVASDSPAGGHNPGDREAAHEAQRCTRIIRNILMSAEYTYLGLRGLVVKRWIPSTSVYQPQAGDVLVQNVMAVRLPLQVDFSEFAPQSDGANTIDFVSVDVIRTEDGQVIAEADYDYT